MARITLIHLAVKSKHAKEERAAPEKPWRFETGAAGSYGCCVPEKILTRDQVEGNTLLENQE
jgi:hypothetical protein